MDLPDKSHIWRIFLRGEKKVEPWEKRWPSELVWYYILFQSYTITNWNHITAPNWGPDNLLKGTIPSEGWPLTPGLPAIFRRMTWLWLQRLHTPAHTHGHTLCISLTHISFWAFPSFLCLLFSILQTLMHKTTNQRSAHLKIVKRNRQKHK